MKDEKNQASHGCKPVGVSVSERNYAFADRRTPTVYCLSPPYTFFYKRVK